MAILDRPRRHLHRHRRARPRRARCPPTSCCRKTPAAIATPRSPASRPLLGLPLDAPIPPGRIDAVKMGTTVATNALLERKGERTLLVVNRGFADALRIGNQARPRLFDLAITLPTMLYEHVVGDRRPRRRRRRRDRTARRSRRARTHSRRRAPRASRACAIVLMHAWKYPEHEQRLAELAREAGFTQVSASHAVSPLLRLVPRGDTTVVDAYLSPILRRYVDQVAGELAGVRLYFMQSNGGLAEAHGFQGKDAILSGPAGGIVGAARTAAMAGLDRIIGFDMGGTSTDVALYAGGVRARVRNRGGRRAHARADDGDQHGRGGRRLDPAFRRRALPRRPGLRRRRSRPGLLPPRRPADRDRRQCLRRQDPAGAFPGDLRPGRRPAARCRRRAREIRRAGRRNRAAPPASARDAASRWPRASCASRSPTWRTRSSRSRCRRATTPPRFALQCFGGAGGQHACLVADALGMETVFIHPFAGVLSAYGMGLADQTVMREQAVEVPLERRDDAGAGGRGRPAGAGGRGGAGRTGRRRGPHHHVARRCTCAMPAPRRR